MIECFQCGTKCRSTAGTCDDVFVLLSNGNLACSRCGHEFSVEKPVDMERGEGYKEQDDEDARRSP